MKTSKLTGPALDWAVAKCEGLLRDDPEVEFYVFCKNHDNNFLHYSTNWAQGGPIIERESIALMHVEHPSPFSYAWAADQYHGQELHMLNGQDMYSFGAKELSYGPTPLIAAMRCFVISKMGDDIEIPEELK